MLAFMAEVVRRGRSRSNGLRALSGTWSTAEREELERAITETEAIDDELWR